MPKKGDKIELDWDLLDKVLRFKPSLVDTAELMKCSEDTLAKRIRERFDCTFTEYRNKKMANTRLTLVQKALKMADAGNVTMLIFCLKNLCGWSDRNDEDGEVQDRTINIKLIDE